MIVCYFKKFRTRNLLKQVEKLSQAYFVSPKNEHPKKKSEEKKGGQKCSIQLQHVPILIKFRALHWQNVPHFSLLK